MESKVFITDRHVIKTGGERLRLQIKKQIEFNQFNKVPGVRAVEIVQDYGNAFVMPYYPNSSFIEFIDHTPCRLDEVYTKLMYVIMQAHDASKIGYVQPQDFGKKFDEVTSTIKMNNPMWLHWDMAPYLLIEKRFRKLLDEMFRHSLDRYAIPIGRCHGDLSLDNILIAPNEDVLLIDFLDTFIDSPLQDIVKLRQDIDYQISWFPRKAKSSWMLKEASKKILDFGHMSYYAEAYPVFQFISLYRILPYVYGDLFYYIYDILLNEEFVL